MNYVLTGVNISLIKCISTALRSSLYNCIPTFSLEMDGEVLNCVRLVNIKIILRKRQRQFLSSTELSTKDSCSNQSVDYQGTCSVPLFVWLSKMLGQLLVSYKSCQL